jgi:hypothetical protein
MFGICFLQIFRPSGAVFLSTFWFYKIGFIQSFREEIRDIRSSEKSAVQTAKKKQTPPRTPKNRSLSRSSKISVPIRVFRVL